jgi:hypothetical protein
MVLAIYPCCKLLGIVGGQVAALLAIVVSYLIQLLRMRDLTGLNPGFYARAFIPATVASAGILFAVYGIHLLGFAVNPGSNIALVTVVCISAYALCVPAFIRANRTT